MSDTENLTGDLDRLLETLDKAGAQPVQPTHAVRDDAIGRELASPRRVSEVRSIRQAPQVRAFREALTDGFVRVDTANQLLRLLNKVIGQWVR